MMTVAIHMNDGSGNHDDDAAGQCNGCRSGRETVKRAGKRRQRVSIVAQLRSTTQILMKIGSLVDFEPKITYPGLFWPFGPILEVILGSKGQKWGKMEIFAGTFRHQKMTVEKSLESIKGAKLSKKFAAFKILKKF